MIPAAEWDAAYRNRTPDDVARIAAFLRLPAAEPFAIAPFVRLATDDGDALAAALLPPVSYPTIEVLSLEHAGNVFTWGVVADGHAGRINRCAEESAVLLVDRGEIHRHRGSALILPPNLADDAILYTDARVWARDWARTRLTFIGRRAIAKRDYLMDLTEPADECYPGALLIGDPNKVRWPAGITFACPDDATAKAVTRAIYRQANLPRAIVAPRSTLREAA